MLGDVRNIVTKLYSGIIHPIHELTFPVRFLVFFGGKGSTAGFFLFRLLFNAH